MPTEKPQPDAPPEGHWLAVFDTPLLRRLLGQRLLDVALSSRLAYLRPPTREGETVRAALAEGTGSNPEVALRVVEGNPAVESQCSRCGQGFGPCLHVAVLALDLACSAELRGALLAGESTIAVAKRAPDARFNLETELRFESALGAWLASAADGAQVEISATPFGEVDPNVGRAYGDKLDPAGRRVLAVVVRRVGERKILASKEIAPGSTDRIHFAARDRAVLDYTRDRAPGKRVVYALGVEASLAIEAMRAHGGVFADGYKGLLDFRPSVVRPAIVALPHGAPRSKPAFDALAALWVADGGGTRISFGDSAFFPGPFPFVWARSGAIFRVARDVDLDMAAELEKTSVLYVPRGKLRDTGARLLRAARDRGIDLPSRTTFGLPAIEAPAVVLRLAGDPLDLTGELVARYGSREVVLVPATPEGDDGRDVETEKRAAARVEAAGLVGADAEAETPRPAAVICARDEAAVAFWQEGLASLRAASEPAIDVQLSAGLANVRVGSPVAGRVHVALEGHWLKTKLEFSSGDLPVELERVRAALARKKRWVALKDGTLAQISSVIAALSEEAAAVMDGEDARLPPHQLGRLERWIEENDGRIDASVDALRGRLRALAVAAEPEMPLGLEATLRPYQKLALAWLEFLQALGAGGILADDMGLGKTITTLAFLQRRKEAEGPAPSLVVCPTSVATNWVREAARFTPGLRVRLHHGPSRDHAATPLADADLVVTTYSLLRRDLETLRSIRFRCAVLDEAQNIKNASSATTRAAGQLDASMRLALSGTPLENRVHELWSLVSFANPGILGTSRAFEARYERPIAADPKSPLAAELRAVIRPFLLRRTKDDVLRDLPPKTEIDRAVLLPNAEKRMYDALAHSLRLSVAKDIDKRNGLASLSVFTALTRLRQMACDPRLVDPRLDRGGAWGAKREAFLQLVRELVAEGRRALVFSQFVQLLTLWREDLDGEKIRYEYLDGSTTKRDEVVARFQEGTAPLFLISLKAGGSGLNLTGADTVIHCDPWWNPAVEDQATDRAHRIGQEKPVTVVRLLARGTIEEKILSLKAKKRELAQAIVQDDARALEGISEDDVRALLGDADATPDESDDDDREDPEGSRPAPTDVLATATEVVDPEFDALVVEVKWWLASTGSFASELASLVEIPGVFAAQLANGHPFPCSRAVADRIRARLRAF